MARYLIHNIMESFENTIKINDKDSFIAFGKIFDLKKNADTDKTSINILGNYSYHNLH